MHCVYMCSIQCTLHHGSVARWLCVHLPLSIIPSRLHARKCVARRVEYWNAVLMYIRYTIYQAIENVRTSEHHEEIIHIDRMCCCSGFWSFFFFCDQIRLVALQSFRKYYLCVRFCCCCSCCTKIDHEICRLTNLINYTDNNRDILLTASIILYYWQWSVTRWWWTDQWPNHLYMNDERMDTVSQCVWGERLFNCVVNKNGQMHCQRTNIINVCHKTVIIILLLYYFKFLFAVCSQYMDILPWKLNDWTIVLAFVCWLFRPNPCRHSELNLSTLQFSTCWRNLIICKFKLKCTSKCDFPFNSIAGACRICVCAI